MKVKEQSDDFRKLSENKIRCHLHRVWHDGVCYECLKDLGGVLD